MAFDLLIAKCDDAIPLSKMQHFTNRAQFMNTHTASLVTVVVTDTQAYYYIDSQSLLQEMLQVIMFRLMNWYQRELTHPSPTALLTALTGSCQASTIHKKYLIMKSMKEEICTVWECDSREGKIKKKATSVMCAIVYSRTYVCLFVHTYM